MMKDLYQHFTPEYREFIDKSLELLNKVEDTYVFERTAFLNPYQVSILKNLASSHEVQVFSSSDYFPSELARVIIAPMYYELDNNDFEISLLEISYASKFYRLTHSQIMGTLLHQLGIERKLFGDIIVSGERIQLFVDKKFTFFFVSQVTKISKTPVRLKEISLLEQVKEVKKSQTKDILVSSLRLDKLVASSFKLSRNQASQLIAGRKVKVNYAINDNPSQQLELNDLISVRKFGRLKVLKENGLSKSGKYKLTIELLPSK